MVKEVAGEKWVVGHGLGLPHGEVQLEEEHAWEEEGGVEHSHGGVCS